MTDVAVIIPHGGHEDEHRAASREWVLAHYRKHHPDWPVILGHSSTPWSKGDAVVDGIAQTDAALLVIADADSFVDPDTLRDAVKLAADEPWAIPHGQVYRLNLEETARVLKGARPRRRHLARSAYLGLAGGGIIAIDRNRYADAGGIDRRFLGWGGEDLSFGLAATTLIGPPARLDAPLWHLWHPPATTNLRGSPESEAHVLRYQCAFGNRRLMRALVDDTEPEPLVPLERPVTFRVGYARRNVRMGHERWLRFRDYRYRTTDPDEVDFLRRLVPNVTEA